MSLKNVPFSLDLSQTYELSILILSRFRCASYYETLIHDRYAPPSPPDPHGLNVGKKKELDQILMGPQQFDDERSSVVFFYCRGLP